MPEWIPEIMHTFDEMPFAEQEGQSVEEEIQLPFAGQEAWQAKPEVPRAEEENQQPFAERKGWFAQQDAQFSEEENQQPFGEQKGWLAQQDTHVTGTVSQTPMPERQRAYLENWRTEAAIHSRLFEQKAQVTPNFFEQQQLAEQRTQLTPRPSEQDVPFTPRPSDLQFAEQETHITANVSPTRASEQQLAPARSAKKYRNKWVYALPLLLILLLAVGAIPAQAYVRGLLTPPAKTAPPLQHILHPETSVIQSPGLESTVSLFMNAMLQKNWSVLWPLLAPDAQKLWQNEQDFTHFEQTKFGNINLQSYTMGQSVISQPWLDPDTTQVYPRAATLSVSMQASAPDGLLTAPSNQELNQGLFQQTLFALIQDDQHTWKVMVAGPADPDAPVLVPAKAPVGHLILPIFMYHHVSSLPTHNLLDYSLTVTTSDFNAQLDWLQKQGYQTITMTELFDAFYYGKALPAKPVILSFDDGYADVYTYALPALLTHHDRGVFYIITGMIGGRYMTWDQVRTMAKSGMEMESHTIHHPNIGILSPNKLQDELQISKATLEAQLQHPIQFFCYPTGEPFHHDSVAEQQLVLKDLFQDGYLGATLDPSVFNSALQNSEIPYQMPRIRVSGGENLSEFMGILTTTLAQDKLRLLNLGKRA